MNEPSTSFPALEFVKDGLESTQAPNNLANIALLKKTNARNSGRPRSEAVGCVGQSDASESQNRNFELAGQTQHFETSLVFTG